MTAESSNNGEAKGDWFKEGEEETLQLIRARLEARASDFTGSAPRFSATVRARRINEHHSNLGEGLLGFIGSAVGGTGKWEEPAGRESRPSDDSKLATENTDEPKV